ncbi:hypothetical protein [Polaribacter gangjinensis]|uniref:Uncharacterized protein n=1 Tax=Polaribacter gangjinensis TaxID=574710 RepID=A0A2S7WDS0_9FLAO|nr:hypothetical protein [Polaribacter gangjinensis]PQJ75769.1 hypothetical protein BTO13_11285 [Polaribacter gangjinensis]
MKIQFFTASFFLFLLVSCNEKPQNSSTCYLNDSRPSQAISYEEMAAMIDAFDSGSKKELDKYLKKVSNGKDSISTIYSWYKLEDLKQYIAYIEKISKEKGIPVTGLRIYPSEYPENFVNQKLKGRQTLIFTPTTTIDGKDDVAFEPLYSETGKPALISEFLEKARMKMSKNSSYLKSTDTTTIQSSSANRIITSPPY